jgi:ribonuclease P protein component
VAREGKRIRTEHLDVRTVASPLRHPRVGLIVPKYGRTSVERNRLKRRLREIVRQDLLPRLSPVDVTIRARREAYGASFAALRDQLRRAGDRLVSSAGARW